MQLHSGADPSLNDQTLAPRYASVFNICQPRRSAFSSTAPRTASTSLGTASVPFSVLPATPVLTMTRTHRRARS